MKKLFSTSPIAPDLLSATFNCFIMRKKKLMEDKKYLFFPQYPCSSFIAPTIKCNSHQFFHFNAFHHRDCRILLSHNFQPRRSDYKFSAISAGQFSASSSYSRLFVLPRSRMSLTESKSKKKYHHHHRHDQQRETSRFVSAKVIPFVPSTAFDDRKRASESAEYGPRGMKWKSFNVFAFIE